MCRQAWFKPGDSARDVKALEVYFAQLEHSCGGHGNGAGYVDPGDGTYNTAKGMTMTVAACAKLVANRPATAWGIFHTRLASAGGKSDGGCHPHVYESMQKDKTVRRLVVLTHNGTWSGWRGANVAMRTDYRTDSATIAALIAQFGFRVVPEVDETIVCATREGGKWRVRAWKDSYPLVLLADGGVASEGGEGEFKATHALCRGGHALSGKDGPRTEPLPLPVTLPRDAAGRWMPRDFAEAGYGEVVMGGAESSDFADRYADLTDPGGYEWQRNRRGGWDRVRKERGAMDPDLYLPGFVKVDPTRQ
jgi:hypothetical protein